MVSVLPNGSNNGWNINLTAEEKTPVTTASNHALTTLETRTSKYSNS